jgi:signal transduction histidine kinase/ligand-binding sensor domain-containing protein
MKLNNYITFSKKYRRQILWNTIVVISLLLNSINSNSQHKYFQFKYLSKNEGLSLSQVTCIHQDYKGFIWIGTRGGGLNKYDGTNFVIYKNIALDSTSIPHNSVMSVFEDRNKNLFIGSYSGLSIYDRNLDQFINLKLYKKSALYGFDELIKKIVEDSNGNLWLATGVGLLCFNYEKNTVMHYKHNSNDATSICDNLLEGVYCDSKSRLWISTVKGLDFINLTTGKLKHIEYCKTHHDTIKSIFQNTATEDKDGNIWFGSNDGLFCLENGQNNNNFELIHFRNNPADPKSLTHKYVKSLFVDNDSTLWIGTDNGGINILNKDKKTFSHIIIDDYYPSGVNNESIYAIFQDRYSNMWFGTYGGGINLALKNMDFIIHYNKLPGAAQGLNSNIINRFLENENGNIWIATVGGGLNQLDINTGRFIHFNSSNSNITSNSLLSFETNGSNNIWIGTWAGGLLNFNKNTHLFTSYTTKNSGISDDNIHSIAKDNNGNLWLGSQNGGLIKYNIKANKFTAFLPENSRISNKRVSVVKINNKGLVYCGATNALQIYNPATNHFFTYKFKANDSTSISNKFVTDILIQNDSMVWVATGYGLNLFNPLTNKFKRFYKEDGLPNNSIAGLALDKFNNLWVSTQDGLCRFDYKSNTIKTFVQSDGLQGNEFIDKSIFTTHDGHILVGGRNGFNIISPNKIVENKRIPNIIITNFQIFYQPVKIGIEGSPLKKQISETKELTLSYEQSVLTFNFVSMDFVNSSKNQYAYMMEGLDADWIYCGNRKEATYTNLSPGKYIFRVKGSNNDGVWNETGTSIEIIITPPWWKTTIAMVGFVIFIIGLFLTIFFYRINQLKHRQLLLEKLVNERTHEIVEKNEILLKQANELNEVNTLLEERQQQISEQYVLLQAQANMVNEANERLKEHQIKIEQKNEMLITQAEQLNETNALLEERQMQIEEQSEELMSQKEELLTQRDNLHDLNITKDRLFSILGHDLRSPFNTILGYSDMLYNNFRKYSTDKIELQIGYIKDTARSTFYLLNNLLEWARSQQGTIQIEPDEILITEILASEVRILEQQAKRKDVKLLKFIKGIESSIEADPNILSTVMRNLISNAIKYSKIGSSIEILLEFQPTHFTFSVKDEGIGMSTQKVSTLFNISTNTSTRGTEGEKGTGLGLILCADFIAKHKGKIWVESQEGDGSTFSFSIPVKQ